MKLKNKKYSQYKGKVYDLEIQSEKNDHSYNVENIVVHNSAVGSAVAYALGITSLNPIEHGLLFERFINPNRRCVLSGQSVLMKDGTYKKIDNISIGDPVQTPNGTGKLIEVINRMTKNEEIIEIETGNGTIISITGNHIIPVFRNGEIIEIRAEDIIESDELISF